MQRQNDSNNTTRRRRYNCKALGNWTGKATENVVTPSTTIANSWLAVGGTARAFIASDGAWSDRVLSSRSFFRCLLGSICLMVIEAGRGKWLRVWINYCGKLEKNKQPLIIAFESKGMNLRSRTALLNLLFIFVEFLNQKFFLDNEDIAIVPNVCLKFFRIT